MHPWRFRIFQHCIIKYFYICLNIIISTNAQSRRIPSKSEHSIKGPYWSFRFPLEKQCCALAEFGELHNCLEACIMMTFIKTLMCTFLGFHIWCNKSRLSGLWRHPDTWMLKKITRKLINSRFVNKKKKKKKKKRHGEEKLLHVLT